MIILDTNVISELMHVAPHEQVLGWLDRQSGGSIWITSITVFEVTFGIEIMVTGTKQTRLRASFETLTTRFADHVALFDVSAAQKTAELMAQRQRLGRPRDLRDTMIAGIVLAHRATLATRNVSHFSDISARVVNPWAAP